MSCKLTPYVHLRGRWGARDVGGSRGLARGGGLGGRGGARRTGGA
jgi:hypothetical protein